MGESPRRGPRALLALLVPLALTGCAAVDYFAPRAVTYNQQAENIKESVLMLNVMRAAYREPLQFTDFTQVTGQTSLSGTAAFTLPFNPSPPTFAHADTASPSATLSGNQAFTVANLDTQEFYEGILSPIPITSIDYYLEQGFPKALLLTLVIGRIDIGLNNNTPVAFYNNYYSDHYETFEQTVGALADLGLSSEVVKTITNVGPPIPAGDIASLRALAPLASGAVLKRFSTTTDPDITPAVRADLARRGITEYYRLQQTTEQSRFCVDPTQQDLPAASAALVALGVLAPGEAVIGPPQGSSAAATEAAAERCGASPYLRLKAEELRGYGEPANRFPALIRTASGTTETATFRVDFTIRSVEGIIYYLGELTRGELDIGVAKRLATPEVSTGLGPERLFVVRENCTGIWNEIGTVYDGTRYCVSIDPSGADRSSEVMEIVLQLLALNTSAKTLPAPSVITVLGQ